jgi:hypothetical protein
MRVLPAALVAAEWGGQGMLRSTGIKVVISRTEMLSYTHMELIAMGYVVFSESFPSL